MRGKRSRGGSGVAASVPVALAVGALVAMPNVGGVLAAIAALALAAVALWAPEQ